MQISLPSLPTGIGTAEFTNNCTGTIAGNGGSCDINLNIDSNAPVGSEFDFFVPVNIAAFSQQLKAHVIITTPQNTADTMYITNRGNGTVSRMSLITNTVNSTNVDLNGYPLSQPGHIIITPDKTKAYIADEGAQEVFILDISANQIVGTVNVGIFGPLVKPSYLAITPDGSKVYLHDNVERILVIDVASNTIQAQVTGIALGNSNPTCTIFLSNNIAYISNPFNANPQVYIVDVNTNAVTGNVSKGTYSPIRPAYFSFNPVTQKVYLGDFNVNSIFRIDVATNTIDDEITVAAPTVISAISPDYTKIYTTLFGSNQVAIIETSNNAVSYIDPNGFPFATPAVTTFNPDGKTAYVGNISGNHISIIEVATNKVTQYANDPSNNLDNPAVIALK